MKIFILLTCFIVWSNTVDGLLNDEVIRNEISNLNGAANVGAQCRKDLLKLVNSLNGSIYSWGWRMLDASSKIRSGIELLSDDIGQFDECIQAKSEEENISGRYCLGEVHITKTNQELSDYLKIKHNSLTNLKALHGINDAANSVINLTWAGCLPKSCDTGSFNYLFNKIFNQISPDLSVTFEDERCATTDDESELSTGTIVTICLFSAFFLFILLVTCFDVYCDYMDREQESIVMAFSMYRNSPKLFKMSRGSGQLECLNGLKFYSMMWVVIGHTYAISITAALSSYMDVLDWANSLHSMLLISGTLSVDTFFVIGGTLVAYIYMQGVEKGKPFNIFLYYLHRYIRLTPALAAVALATATFYPYLGSGPYWSNVRMDQKMCQDDWWSTLLYIQNYATVPNLCVGVSWYLAVDTQLYLLSPILLYGLKRFAKWTVSGIIVIILLISGINFYISWNGHFAALLSNMYVDNSEYMTNFYIKTHARAGTWLLGIIIGYIVSEIKQNRLKFKPNKILNIFLWICTIFILLVCIFIGHTYLRQKDYKLWGNSLHIALVRQFWSVAIGWIIVSCMLGGGGPVNWFLSFPIYQVLNRFTYSVYLLHYYVITLWISSTRSPIHFSDIMMGYYFWGNLLFSTILSYFWVLAFESPVIILEKKILGPLINSRQKATI